MGMSFVRFKYFAADNHRRDTTMGFVEWLFESRDTCGPSGAGSLVMQIMTEGEAREKRRTFAIDTALITLLGAFMVLGCAKTDINAKYRDAQLVVGLTVEEIDSRFGEPDSFSDYWNSDGSRYFVSDTEVGPASAYSKDNIKTHTHHIQHLRYGAFGAHDQQRGHVTKHRLSLFFVNGKLTDWEKSTPVEDR